METRASNRNTGLWRNIIKVKIGNLGVQMYPCGFTNYFAHLPLYHTHRYHEFFFIGGGVSRLTTPKGEYNFSAGECFIVPAGVPHYRSVAGENGVDFAYDLRFSLFHEVEDERSVDLYRPLQQLLEHADDVIPIPNGSCLKRMVSAINAENLEMYPFSELKFKAEITALMIDMYRLLIDEESLHPASADESKADESSDDLFIAIDFLINRRFAHPALTIEELAELLHLSVRQTERMVMKMYGKTFKRKMMEVRLKNARMVLRYTNAPIAEVAKFCGYKSHSGLIKAFTEEFDISPAEYRASFRDK